MADRSGIEWTEATWNPLTGCEWASPGCDGCYAAREAGTRLSSQPAYQGLAVRHTDGQFRFTGELRLLPERLDKPLRWKRPRRIFVDASSDLFHPDVPADYIARVFAVMALAPQHSFQVLTKRSQRMRRLLASPDFQNMVTASALHRAGSHERLLDGHYPLPLPNVWLGVSVESQDYAWRVEHLRQTPAAVRWVSVEPLVGPITDPHAVVRGMDWIVAGGESGHLARPCHPDWLRALRDECEFRDVPFLVKQWGEWAPGWPAHARWHLQGAKPGTFVSLRPDGTRDELGMVSEGAELLYRIGKREAGRELDGKVWDEYPRVRS